MVITFKPVFPVNSSTIKNITNMQKTQTRVSFGTSNDTFEKKATDVETIETIMATLDAMIAQITKERDAELSKGYYRLNRSKLQQLNKKIEELNGLKSVEIIQRYFAEKETAPNTSFLFNPVLSKQEKKEILAQHPEIKYLTNICQEFSEMDSVIKSGRYFESKKIDKYTYIDLSTPLNAQNYRTLQSCKPTTYKRFAMKTGIDYEDVKRYANTGILEQVKLLDVETQEEMGVKAVNEDSDITANGLRRYRKLQSLSPKASKQIAGIINSGKEPIVPLFFLKKLGFGDEEVILKELKNHKIEIVERKIIDKNQQTHIVPHVRIMDKKAYSTLQYIKGQNQAVWTIDELSKQTKAGKTEIEDALLSGELKPIRTSLLYDEREIKIDISLQENKDFIDKKLFEYEVSKENKKQETSLQYKLAWHFCPKTKEAASLAFSESKKDIQDIKTQIDEAKRKLSTPTLSPEEVEELEDKIDRLETEREILTKQSYKKMWTIAGEEEYKAGMTKAKTIVEQLKTQGISSIEDEEIRNFIIENRN